ncbi:MAG: glycosyl hydrolase family 28-related protein [Trebonia sp.]
MAATACSSGTAGGPAELTAASFSNVSCAASGATSNQLFPLSAANSVGTADDTEAIQSAINTAAAAGGGTVRIPAGTYLIDGHVVLKSNVKLIGAGPSTILKAGPGFLATTGPAGGYPLITTAGARNVTIADISADQSGNTLDADAHQAARLAAYLIDVRDSENAVVTGVRTRNPFTYSIAVVGSSGFCVSRCDTQVATSGRYDQLDGIHVLDSHDGQVIGNHVDQRIGTDGDDGLVAHTILAPVYDVLFADNTVRGGNDGDGMQLAVGKYPIYDVTIRDNNFWGSPYGIRTGYWGTGPGGTVRGIYITGNYIHDLVPGFAFPHGGNAVNIGGFGAVGPVEDVVVTGNDVCRAGAIIVARGTGNVVARNRFC